MKVVVIGWQGVDWKALHPLVDAGLMPNLAALIERGVIGSVRAVGPGAPAILWTSVATGKTADQHGILSGAEADPLSGALRDISSTSRTSKALWNIAMQSGLRAHAVGWSATHPAEALNGSCVTPPFTKPSVRRGEPWPVSPDSLYPERLAEPLAALRIHAGELTGDDLLPFLPNLARIDQEHDTRAIEVAVLLARSISIQGVSTWLLENEPWDLMMIGWDAVATACFRFLEYAVPQLPFVSDNDFAIYSEVVKGMLCFHDMLLGRIVKLAGPEAAIVIASPTGFRTGPERPVIEGWRRNPGAWVRPYGALVMAGPEIRKDQLVHGVTHFDIAPTVLSLLGLSAGADMPGRVIQHAFRKSRGDDRIPSWEQMPGDSGMHARETEQERAAGAAAIEALAAQGYTIPEPHPNEAVIEHNCLLNRALVYMSLGRFSDARNTFEQLVSKAPDQTQLRLRLAYTQQMSGDDAGCRKTLAGIHADGLMGAMASLLEAHLEAGSPQGLEAVRRAEALAPDISVVCYLASAVYVHLKLWEDAERLLRRSIELDPGFQPGLGMLSHVLAARGRSGEAVEAALKALEIDHGSAQSHFALGLALVGDGDSQRAMLAFDWSRELNPELREAGLWSAAIRLRELSQAAARREAEK